jgi:HEPN domain-containing protein
MRREPLEEGQRWLDQAREDLLSAELLLDGGRHYLVCFLAQQVAEKAIKSYLYAGGEELVTGHSVERLGRRVVEQERKLQEAVAPAAELDAYYVPTRYPNGLPDSIPARVFGQDAAVRALGLARAVVDAVSAHWPEAQG